MAQVEGARSLLAEANGLSHELAHDALSDTRATLELTRLIRSKAPNVWEAIYATRSKVEASNIIGAPVFFYTRRGFGTPTIPATRVVANPGYNAEIAVYDLRVDPTDILDTGPSEIETLAQGPDRAFRILKINANPIVMLGEEHLEKHGLSKEEALQRARLVQQHPTFSNNVAHYLEGRFEDTEPPERVEDMIYAGFYSSSDERLISRFHEVSWDERRPMVDQFEDDRLKQLSRRLIYCEHPESLTDKERETFDATVRTRLSSNEKVPWTTIAKARDEIAELRESADPSGMAILDDYENILKRFQ